MCAGRGKDLGDGDGRMEREERAGGRAMGRRSEVSISLLHLRLSFLLPPGRGGSGQGGS